jgi:hypothetical protein
MKSFLSGVSLFVLTASAASVPSGWSPVKDEQGACQVAVPHDFKAHYPKMPSLVKSQDGKIEVQVVNQPGKTVTPLDSAAQKVLAIDKLFDNTPQRVFFANKPVTFAGTQVTSWNVRVPGSNSVCFVTITLKPGASEDTAKKIAQTVGPAK